MNTNKNQSQINVGVDTGKYQLDIHVRPLDVFFSVSIDKEGIADAIKKLKNYHPDRVTIEATAENSFILVN